jgi:hypothetical protein
MARELEGSSGVAVACSPGAVIAWPLPAHDGKEAV